MDPGFRSNLNNCLQGIKLFYFDGGLGLGFHYLLLEKIKPVCYNFKKFEAIWKLTNWMQSETKLVSRMKVPNNKF